jgi:hypothetical protein
VITLKGIGREDIKFPVDTPPASYKKVAAKADHKGNFKVEVYKLVNFNAEAKEAFYEKRKDEKAKVNLDLKFNFATPKKDEFDEIED